MCVPQRLGHQLAAEERNLAAPRKHERRIVLPFLPPGGLQSEDVTIEPETVVEMGHQHPDIVELECGNGGWVERRGGDGKSGGDKHGLHLDLQ